MAKEELLCPSSRCEPGAQLIGIVGSEGRVGLVNPPLPVDESFVEIAAAGRSPERRFRFASRCLQSGCGQWTGSACGVAKRVIGLAAAGALPVEELGEELPECGIRPRCRWFAEHAGRACAVCPLVVTDLTASETEAWLAEAAATAGLRGQPTLIRSSTTSDA